MHQFWLKLTFPTLKYPKRKLKMNAIISPRAVNLARNLAVSYTQKSMDFPHDANTREVRDSAIELADFCLYYAANQEGGVKAITERAEAPFEGHYSSMPKPERAN
jgi:hypothetical protein